MQCAFIFFSSDKTHFKGPNKSYRQGKAALIQKAKKNGVTCLPLKTWVGLEMVPKLYSVNWRTFSGKLESHPVI